MFAIEGKHRLMFYKQSENIHDTRFIDGDGDISQIHELLKSDCNIKHLHLKTKYNFDRNNKYTYYNPNLIRNNGLIKKDQQLHCDFQTSIIPFPNNSKDSNQINVETIVISPTRKRRKKTIRIMLRQQ